MHYRGMQVEFFVVLMIVAWFTFIEKMLYVFFVQ